ncbi:YtxH domain-containing protein [Metabacillus sp. KIGAM252]|uniref:YtxH domain-containing protein n=1 Tax=Metabacillus flavus TaxID=2823519 RepID=A0ABS5LDF6_9BACI|nr:YtxH domain-containing protein [Metabacillus flavus]MBS2968775.1 YtxH domain-containing protein [Metabacillus flavus]
MTQVTIQDSKRQKDKNSKLVRGMILGAIIGGAVSMLDSTTRSKVTKGAAGIKDSTVGIVQNVKDNPGEVKDQFVSQFNNARSTLESAIRDAQNIYESLNNGVFKKITEVAATSQEALNNVKEAAGDVKDVGVKVADAGSELTEPLSQENETRSSSTSTANFESSIPSQSGRAEDSAKL